MRQITSKLFVGNIGEFGDAGLLATTGIELAFLCHGGKGFPHTDNISAIAIILKEDGLSPAWYIRGLAKMLGGIYGLRVMSLHDYAGGMTLASFLICCAAADKLVTSFNTQKTSLETILSPDMKIPPALLAQGASLWP